MKKISLFALIRSVFKLFSLFSILIGISHAQWQPEIRLTNDPAESYISGNNTWGIATSGSNVIVVWADLRNGNLEIYFKRSNDLGTSWLADTRLTNNEYRSWYPSVAVSGQVVHLVWEDSRDGNQEIYYKRSTDSGVTWGVDTRMTNNTVYSSGPSIAVYDQVVLIVWYNNRDGNDEIYNKRSSDGGITWSADIRLTNNTASSSIPSVSISAQIVNVVWMDYRDGNSEIYNKRSTDVGLSWSSDTRLTNNSATSWYPSLGVSSQNVHVVWEDNRDGNKEIYYKRSTDGGVNWSVDKRLTNNSATSEYPTVAVSSQIVHVGWVDRRHGNTEIYYKRSTDEGINWSADERLSNNTAYSDYPSVAISAQVAHIVWSDYRDGNYEIYYRRNPTGNSIGISNISSEIPNRFSLQQNYPNPFNPNTKIKFELPKSSDIEFNVYDILGRKVYSAYYNKLAGTYEIDFDGSSIASGIYFYSGKAGEYSETKKMILIK